MQATSVLFENPSRISLITIRLIIFWIIYILVEIRKMLSIIILTILHYIFHVSCLKFFTGTAEITLEGFLLDVDQFL
jgi:hypothetical protein